MDQTLISTVENGLLTMPTYILGRPRLQASLLERMQAYNVPGVSLAVINNYAIEWAKGYGITDVIQPTPITVDTRFYAASISKPLAAMAALALVQVGLLDLDEDINRKLVSWGVPKNGYTHLEKVTLRRLLSHSAGLEAGSYCGYGSDEAVPTLRQLLEGEPPSNSGPVRVTFVPGSQAVYSGPGYWVLQQLLEDVTGQPFAVLLDQIVCQKLGLPHSTFHQPLPQVHAVMAATGHDASGRPIEERDSRHPGLADGGLWSTPSDLARFLIELQLSYRGSSNKVLSQAITQEMLAKQIDYHGLGLHLFGDGPTMRLSHGGEGEGFQCLMAAFRETGQGAVAMANGVNGYPLIQEIFRSLAEAYNWPDYKAVGKPVLAIDPELYPTYEGDYQLFDQIEQYGDYTGQWQVQNMSKVIFSVKRSQEGLLLRDPVGNELLYYPQSPTTFFALERDGEITFVNDENNRVDTLALVFSHANFKARRVDDR